MSATPLWESPYRLTGSKPMVSTLSDVCSLTTGGTQMSSRPSNIAAHLIDTAYRKIKRITTERTRVYAHHGIAYVYRSTLHGTLPNNKHVLDAYHPGR